MEGAPWYLWCGLMVTIPLIWAQETCPESELDILLGTVIVGCGTAPSCNEKVLIRQLGRAQPGSTLVFNCGPNDIVIPLSNTLWLERSVTIDGGKRVTLDGQGQKRHFIIANRNTSLGVNASGLAVTIKDIRLVNGSANPVPMGRRSCQTGDKREAGGQCTGRPLQSQDGLLINPVLKRDGGSVYLGEGGRLVLLSVTVEDSHSNGTPEPAEKPNDVTYKGGAVFVGNGGLLVVVNCQFTNNSASQSGGAIHVSRGAQRLQVSASSFHDNNVTGSDGQENDGKGGAIYVEGTTTLFQAAKFSGNTATEGGALFILDNTLSIKDCQFLKNLARGGQGGAAYVENTAAGIQTSQFRGNTANDGGALYSSDNALSIRECQLSANQAILTESGSSGGALFVIGGTTDITATSFEENQSTDKGGAVYICTDAGATFGTSTFCGNEVSSSKTHSGGGAVYRDCAGSLLFSEVTMTGNIAKKFGIVSKTGSNLLDVVGDATVETSDIAGLSAINGTVQPEPGTVCPIIFCQTYSHLCDNPGKTTEPTTENTPSPTLDSSNSKNITQENRLNNIQQSDTSANIGTGSQGSVLDGSNLVIVVTPITGPVLSSPTTTSTTLTTTQATTTTQSSTTTTTTVPTTSPTTTTTSTTPSPTTTPSTTTSTSVTLKTADSEGNSANGAILPGSDPTISTTTTASTTTPTTSTSPKSTKIDQSGVNVGQPSTPSTATDGSSSTHPSTPATSIIINPLFNTSVSGTQTKSNSTSPFLRGSGRETPDGVGGKNGTNGPSLGGSSEGNGDTADTGTGSDIGDISVTEDNTIFTRSGNTGSASNTETSGNASSTTNKSDTTQQSNTTPTSQATNSAGDRSGKGDSNGGSDTTGKDSGASIIIPSSPVPTAPETINITISRGPPATSTTLHCVSVTAHTNNWENRNLIVARCPKEHSLVGCSSQSPGGARRRGEQFVIVAGRMACSAHRTPSDGGVVAIARCCKLPPQGSCSYQLGSESGHKNGSISQAQCSRGSLTSCGVFGDHGYLGGSKPLTASHSLTSLQDTAGICQAFNGEDATPSGVFAKAVCCQVPQLTCRAKFSLRSPPGGNTAVTCDSNWFLTGCSAWSPSSHGTGSTPTDQTGNTCLASSQNVNNSSGVWAIATCCSLQSSTGDDSSEGQPGTGDNTVCDGKVCENGGTLLHNGCRCRCALGYQGSSCQINREQASKGVVIIFKTNDFNKIKLQVMNSIAVKLSLHCNEPSHFSRCCPGSGSKGRGDFLPYVTADDIRIADGYPEVVASGIKVMFLVTPSATNQLCTEGGTINTRTERSVVVVRKRRNTFGDGFLDQDILLEVIQESAPNITQETGVEILSIEPGKEDVQGLDVKTSNHRESLPSWVMPLVIGCCVITVTAVIMTIVAVVKMKQRKSQSSPTKSDSEISESTEDVGSNMWEVREARDAARETRLPRKAIKYPESMTLPSVRGYKPYPHGTVSHPTMYYTDYPAYYGMFYNPTTMYYPTQQTQQQSQT